MNAPDPVPDFDVLAWPYRWLEYLSFGPYLQRTRTHFLEELQTCRRALVLGDGDGRFTARLLRMNPHVAILAVDASSKMLEALRRAAGLDAVRVVTEIADLRQWQPAATAGYDLVVTHFFLDCLTTRQISELAERLRPSTDPQTLWLVSEFAIPATLFGRMVARPLVTSLYWAFGLLTGLKLDRLPDHAEVLAAHGWRLRSSHARLGGLLISQLWQHGPELD